MMHTAGPSKSDAARIAVVLCLAAVAVVACWALAPMRSLCPTVYPAPPECFGTDRAPIALLASTIIVVIALVLFVVFVVRGRDARTRIGASLGRALGIAVVAGPLVVVSSAGFVVDGGLVALGAVVLSCAVGIVALTRERSEHRSDDREPRNSAEVTRDTPGMQG
ncbi:hypothetical protein [Agromyces atrinae]|uniref:Uncharacterized protein n=1 Tax=Agromyces atrinae TaxID=592376 RepID=A0A4Q2MAI9_9MICO|nr:hypothetical protein [Agromyces atrinae]NYD66421.1 hypothetical protein [Agromyces atrinae]RXZ87101.1 hypothetical protein ESP50_04025 [Agromyces atrinae]